MDENYSFKYNGDLQLSTILSRELQWLDPQYTYKTHSSKVMAGSKTPTDNRV